MRKMNWLHLLLIAAAPAAAQNSLLKFEPVNFSKVNITDQFWKPKIDKVATKTLEACIYQTEDKTARIRNYEKVARNKGEKHEGIYYDDSDVFKALEAIAYALKSHPDAAREKKADEWIDKIAAAQQPDGYLNTYYTLNEPISKRYSDMGMHEDYIGGHMIEAAIAYYEATGKRKLLDVAIRWADHFDALFGPGKKDWVTGHQELELALVKLYRTTKNEKYLKLSHWLLEERGHKLGVGRTLADPAYAQDVVPVRDQKEITGHAVRAMYLYTGAADVAALTGDEGYLRAMRTVWEDVVHRNMYITGGIGSSGSNEGFSVDYDLPNEQAYCETCASVGMVFWNQRMNALTGESEYIDVLERSLYNGALDGLSLSGDRFFYGNPLASNGRNARREWFGTACCPSNIARLVASLGNYVYAKSDNDIWVNLYVGSNTTIRLANGEVPVTMQTNYPWDGNIKLALGNDKKMKYALRMRIPGWSQNTVAPGGLYQFTDNNAATVTITVNRVPIQYKMEKGYAVIDREWSKGDKVEMNIPMNIRKVVARNELKFDNDRVALQRGPLVYCVEGVDNGGQAFNVLLTDNTKLITGNANVLTEQVVAIKANTPVATVGSDGVSIKTDNKQVTAIPYYVWCNRGNTQMQVWLPNKIKEVKLNY